MGQVLLALDLELLEAVAVVEGTALMGRARRELRLDGAARSRRSARALGPKGCATRCRMAQQRDELRVEQNGRALECGIHREGPHLKDAVP